MCPILALAICHLATKVLKENFVRAHLVLKSKPIGCGMTTQIHGIVVAFDGMHGVLLLQHRSFPTVEDLAQKYAASDEDRGFWFASFTWGAIAEHDKKCIQTIQSMSRRRAGIKGKQKSN